MADVTEILSQIERGQRDASEQLLVLVYEELRRLAAAEMARENPGQTLDATALVHEAYLRLVGDHQVGHWNGRTHFFRAAAEAMRRILVDSARRKRSLKRGGGLKRVDLETVPPINDPAIEDVVEISAALDRLALHDPQKAELVKLRYFVGLTVQEAADALGVSRATADRHWAYARTWLYCDLTRMKVEGPVGDADDADERPEPGAETHPCDR